MAQSVPDSFLAPGRSREDLTVALHRGAALRNHLDKVFLSAEEAEVRACQTAASAKQADEFYRRAIFLLYRLVSAPAPDIETNLTTFREMLMERVGPEHLAPLLRELEAALEQNTREAPPVVKLGPEAGSGQKCPQAEPLRNDLLEKYRQVYVELLEALRLDLDEEYTSQVGKLMALVMGCRDMETLFVLGGEVAEIVRRFSREVVDKRREAQAFATEVLSNLADLHAYLKATVAQSDERSRSDTAFSDSLDSQLDTLHRSLERTADLESLKTLIQDGLRSVKEAVQRKRQEDQALLGETQRQLTAIRSEFGKLAKMVASVQRENMALARKVQFDPLTGIYNRYAFTRRLESEHARIKRYGSTASVVMADIDHFKVINDTYGHLVGDKVLVEVAQRLKSALRESDFLARYGGEEFVVIMPETSLENALAGAEKMRERIENTDFMVRDQVLGITISCGVAEVAAAAQSTLQALDSADRALYQAKRTGRNKVCGE